MREVERKDEGRREGRRELPHSGEAWRHNHRRGSQPLVQAVLVAPVRLLEDG